MKAAALALMAALALGQPATYKGAGTVVAVDRDMGRVTIEAEPIEALKLPALALAFNVHDQRVWNRVYRGRYVEFEFIKQGNNYLLLRVLNTN